MPITSEDSYLNMVAKDAFVSTTFPSWVMATPSKVASASLLKRSSLSLSSSSDRLRSVMSRTMPMNRVSSPSRVSERDSSSGNSVPSLHCPASSSLGCPITCASPVPAASPPGCPPARGGARSPRARAHVERAGSPPQSPPRSARATEHGLGQHRRCPFQDPASPRLLTQLVGRNQADPHGVECCLGAAPHVQLREDAVHMGLDCTLPDEELASDLLVGFAPSQELQDLCLTSGEGLR